ncbi:MAG: endonuclease III domain-containing protein [Nitrospinae bacterium]|nr:endonuclease III domain-containing protein [Nitrospinota bacterium]
MLTQNASWGNVEKALANIRARGALSLAKLHAMPDEELAELIRPSGYFRLKAKRLKHLLAFLADVKGGKWRDFLRSLSLEKARETLLKVHGVGPETADSILLYSADMPSFVVDKYTLRIGGRCGWFPHGTKYEEARAIFMESVAKNVKVYNEFHALIVRLGANFCKTKPLCADCPLNSVCPKKI